MFLENFIKNYFKMHEYEIVKLPQDASKRIYYRLFVKENNSQKKISFIVVDSSLEINSMISFCKISDILRKYNIRIPDILETDNDLGYMIIEDFGNNKLSSVLSNENERDFYKASVDNLIFFYNHDMAYAIQAYNNLDNLKRNNYSLESFLGLLIKELDVFFNYYYPYRFGDMISDLEKQSFINNYIELFSMLNNFKLVLNLGDYHIDNIMILNEEEKILGFIDYQDAFWGCGTYDLGSLLHDSRRLVSKDLSNELIKHYSINTGQDFDEVMLRFNVISLQNSFRKLGVFAKKFLLEGNKNYLHYIPITQHYANSIIEDLSKKSIKNLLKYFQKFI